LAPISCSDPPGFVDSVCDCVGVIAKSMLAPAVAPDGITAIPEDNAIGLPDRKC